MKNLATYYKNSKESKYETDSLEFRADMGTQCLCNNPLMNIYLVYQMSEWHNSILNHKMDGERINSHK